MQIPFQPLIQTPEIEVENQFRLPIAGFKWLQARFQENGFNVSNSCPISIYLDTAPQGQAHPLLFSKGISLRFRAGGQSTCGEQYSDILGLKTRAHTLQARSRALTQSLGVSPDLAPFIRREIEPTHLNGQGMKDLNFDDLPETLQTAIRSVLQNRSLPGTRFVPRLITSAQRTKMKVFIDPDTRIIAPAPTFLMQKKQTYICLEAAFDKCTFLRFPQNGVVGPVLQALKESDHTYSGFRHLTTVPIFEFEHKPAHSGKKATDLGLVKAFLRFELYIEGALAEANIPLTPIVSKSATGFGLLPPFRVGGAKRPQCPTQAKAYQTFLKFAA
jgi:hypothetical protein